MLLHKNNSTYAQVIKRRKGKTFHTCNRIIKTWQDGWGLSELRATCCYTFHPHPSPSLEKEAEGKFTKTISSREWICWRLFFLLWKKCCEVLFLTVSFWFWLFFCCCGHSKGHLFYFFNSLVEKQGIRCKNTGRFQVWVGVDVLSEKK